MVIHTTPRAPALLRGRYPQTPRPKPRPPFLRAMQAMRTQPPDGRVPTRHYELATGTPCVQTVSITSDRLTAQIAAVGAELVSLSDGQNHELLWSGNQTWWTGRSPLLFPIVG